jgi:hypothetical protein
MLLDFGNSIDVGRARAYLDKLVKEKKRCEIKSIRERRTARQNSYLHVCIGMFCAETGYTVDEAKELFSLQNPDEFRYSKNGVSFRKPTSEMNTKEMTNFIDLIRSMAYDQLGLYIPTSQEYLENQFQIERELELQGINYGK